MTRPPSPPSPTDRINIRAVISVVETIAFICAIVLQALGHGNDAIVSALVGAAGHAVNHPAGGSPI